MDNEHPTALRGFDSYEMKLGDELRGHRATLGKSLLDVQRELRIKASYIDAIENCDASVVPNKGFVPGYVRAYARYLGLDPEHVYTRFRQESGFVGQNTAGAAQQRAAGGLPFGGARGRMSGLAGLAFGGAGAATRGGARPGRDPSLSRSHFASPVGRARPVGLGVSLSDIASVAVLAGLVCGLGYGAWALVEDIQRVDFAPSNERPELAEAPATVALPGLSVQAATRAWPGAEDAPISATGDVEPAYTASRVWPASAELALHVADVVRGRSVVELGAGAGLAGLASAVLGAARVVLTDLAENLPLLQRNAARNGLDVSVAAFDWLTPTTLGERFDVVLAADCVFWPELFEPLLNAIAAVARPDGTLLVAVTHRLGRTDAFLEKLRRRGWTASPRPRRRDAPQNTDVYEVKY